MMSVMVGTGLRQYHRGHFILIPTVGDYRTNKMLANARDWRRYVLFIPGSKLEYGFNVHLFIRESLI